MKHFTDYSDDRTRGMCIYCGGLPETREHVPPRVFLDKPYPPDLPIVEACSRCNNAYSMDEEYMACLIDCVISGTADSNALQRETTKKSLLHALGLAERIARARRETDDGVIFDVEHDRVMNVIKKVAAGHVLYELGSLFPLEKAEVNIAPFTSLDPESTSCFENLGVGELALWPEVGSRAIQRLLIGDENYENGWIHVQRGRYRYSVTQNDVIETRIVFSEYLACSVRWQE
jgi:hypothetical protein